MSKNLRLLSPIKLSKKLAFSPKVLATVNAGKTKRNIVEGNVYTFPMDLRKKLSPLLLELKDSPLGSLSPSLEYPSNSEYGIDEDEVCASPEIAHGKGSVGEHDDNLFGISLLTLIYTSSPGVFKLVSDTSTHEVQLNSGESLVFDDREVHSWDCSGEWFFAVNKIYLSKLSEAPLK